MSYKLQPTYGVLYLLYRYFEFYFYTFILNTINTYQEFTLI